MTTVLCLPFDSSGHPSAIETVEIFVDQIVPNSAQSFVCAFCSRIPETFVFWVKRASVNHMVVEIDMIHRSFPNADHLSSAVWTEIFSSTALQHDQRKCVTPAASELIFFKIHPFCWFFFVLVFAITLTAKLIHYDQPLSFICAPQYGQ